MIPPTLQTSSPRQGLPEAKDGNKEHIPVNWIPATSMDGGGNGYRPFAALPPSLEVGSAEEDIESSSPIPADMTA
jgi:hypothetical protein